MTDAIEDYRALGIAEARAYYLVQRRSRDGVDPDLADSLNHTLRAALAAPAPRAADAPPGAETGR